VIGLLAVPIGFAVRILGLVASIPPRTARVLQLHRWSQARGASDGRVVLRGSVKALRTVTTLTGTPAVFVHTHAIGKGRGTDIAYGEDFLVVDDSPIPARISVRHALLVDSPTRVSGSWSSVPLVALPVLPHLLTSTSIKEAVIFPGEQVEVIGHLDTVVDPSVADRLGRQPPLVRVFYGTPESPLLLRTLRPESPIAPA
jgi:hypothetical protein